MLKTGTRMKSQVCDTQVIIVRAPTREVALTCGGHPMVELTAETAQGLQIDPALSTGSPLGKRFTLADEEGLEVLVTKAGAGTLADGTSPLVAKDAKPLPASD
jgi:hypothetical protein